MITCWGENITEQWHVSYYVGTPDSMAAGGGGRGGGGGGGGGGEREREGKRGRGRERERERRRESGKGGTRGSQPGIMHLWRRRRTHALLWRGGGAEGEGRYCRTYLYTTYMGTYM